MAFSHGSKAIIKVADGSNVITDVSAYVKSVKQPRKATTAEVTVLGNTAKKYIPGLFEGNVSIEGMYDPAADAIFAAALANQRNFEYYPNGTATGQIKYTGALIGTSYDVHSPVT